MTPAPHIPPTAGVLDKLQRRTLMKVLEQVPDRLDDLEVTITRTDALRPANLGTSGHKERVVPFNQRASDARVNLSRAVRTYALRVAVVTGVPAPHGPTAQSRYLVAHLPGIADDAASIHGIYSAVVGAADAARRAIDRPQERRYAGSCECGTRLYATETQETVTCRGCGLQWPVEEVRAWMMEQAKDTLGSAAELARLLPWFNGEPVKASTISKWAERGKLQAVMVDGTPRYRIGDVVELHKSSNPVADEYAELRDDAA
ncbi:DUF1922 domain-containing protein [Prescottella equi]|uniref:DUF1922 domain-containing protein n=1 Tax=Rhodococcus hoagii TaxID=43767 RepID=UPI00131D2FF8|nr:DUF1922 domain-containing protein [Prescottella equi]